MVKAGRVLLVEDNVDTRAIYALMLREHGYEVIEAGDGAAAVTLARAEQPDLVVMNFVLPRLDGVSAVMQIRADPAVSAIPIIACTAYVRPEGMELAEEAGCDSYLEKPCAPSRLLAEVQRFLGPVPAGA